MERKVKELLDSAVKQYNQPSFIKDDPVRVPHSFSKKQDIEISGLFAAIFAWGNRTTIIRKSLELMKLMDDAPHSFILNHTDNDLKSLLNFKHRTFNSTDLLYFVEFLHSHYSSNSSLESAFNRNMQKGDDNLENALNGFYEYFFSLEHIPYRTRKHIASPQHGSSCKRLNMFLRWMVRKDKNGVDFGIWKSISPSQLVCPIDVHVARVARQLKLLTRKQVDWLAAIELTNELRTLDPVDPVKYDFALFGLSALDPHLKKQR